MALRQTVARFECDVVGSEVRDLPSDIDFTTVELTDVSRPRKVVEAIVGSRCVNLYSKFALGKSTAFPFELSKVTKEMVVLVVPYEQLAMVLFHHVSKKTNSVPVSLWRNVADVRGVSGVVITHAGCLAAYWLQSNILSMPRCILLHDECHEVGAFTGLLEVVGPCLSGVISYVRMSATGEDSLCYSAMPNPVVKEMQYVSSAFLDPWSVEEIGAPWSISSMNGNIILFEDDRSRASQLIQAYNMGGIACFHWTSTTAPDVVLANCVEMDLCRDRHFAIVADSTYRSGYSLPVTIVVDSGRVKRLGVDDNKAVAYTTREITKVESAQAKWRSGRSASLPAVYWRPSGKLSDSAAPMHSTDLEALAAMLLALGFRLGNCDWFEHTIAAKGKLPRNLYFSLSGDTPLEILPRASFCTVAEYNRFAFSSSYAHADYGEMEDEECEDEADWVQNLKNNLRNLSMFDDCENHSDDAELPAVGGYLEADGVCGQLANDVFPDGVNSVLRVLDASNADDLVLRWDEDVRCQATYLLLNAYNSNNVQLRGSAKALASVRNSQAQVDSAVLRDWATKVSEGVLQLTVASEKFYSKIVYLSKSRYKLKLASFDLSDQEEVFKEYLVSSFNRSVRRRSTSSRSSTGSSLPSVSEDGSISCVYSKPKKKVLSDYPGYSKRMHFVYWAAGAPKKRYKKDLQMHEEWLGNRSSSRGSTSSSVRGR